MKRGSATIIGNIGDSLGLGVPLDPEYLLVVRESDSPDNNSNGPEISDISSTAQNPIYAPDETGTKSLSTLPTTQNEINTTGTSGTPPCQRCIIDKRECILGDSNRGGHRTRKNSAAVELASLVNSDSTPGRSSHRQSVSMSSSTDAIPILVGDESEVPIGPPPQNPSDAWQCLASIAKENHGDASDSPAGRIPPRTGGINVYCSLQSGPTAGRLSSTGIKAYRLVQSRSLDPETIWQLVVRYAENFHPHLPLVPRKYFDRTALDAFAEGEKHLLTAVLTIASMDLVDQPGVHECCSKYMHELISGIAAGADCDIEAVEALLLLAEWEPRGLRPRIERVGRGEEDRASWMHVGIALRSGYFLGLDRTSFRGDPSGDTEAEARKRLAWTCCYISDRLISVRIGRAFWSRGPGPMTGLVSQDFPSLQPIKEGDEDYARILQAMLDLTQLYGNVHDVLYTGMRTSNQMMLMGDYVKYVDDFRIAALRWKSLWWSLPCSRPIKITLQMSYEYLRLYTNAFAFQAAISQSLVSKPKDNDQSQKEHLRKAFSNVASMPDARFIYESVDAAKSYLINLVESVDPEKYLHFMPLRFYLYSIYAAVFLYKARSFEILTQSEEMSVRDLITRATDVLKRASTGPDDIGIRYARLLELLWKSKHAPAACTAAVQSSSSIQTENTFQGSFPGQGSYMHFSPANDFSWLDLEAVGDYVSGDQIPDSGSLDIDILQTRDVFAAVERSQLLQPPTWTGNISLFF